MFPASNKGSGFVVSFPDVCKVPHSVATTGVPIPYPNIATTAIAKQQAKQNVKVVAGRKHVKSTRSQGDAAGASTGIISSKIMGKAAPRMRSNKVMAEGQRLRTMLDGIHATMRNGNQNDPQWWQGVLQTYATTLAALFMTINDD